MPPVDPSELEQARQDPRRRFERFVLLSELGRGGMGVVYRAWDERAGRPVALKLLLEPDPAAAERMVREAEAVARLKHPGIVAVHDAGRVGGRAFVALELVEGGPLTQLPTPAPVDEALRIGVALAEALEHAHARGVIHRDLKPANVLLDPAGAPRVLDFGLALLADRSRLTRSGTLLGTAAYMPPEQIEGRADARSDVYAVGGVLYWLLTGTPPFAGATVENVLVAAMNERPRAPSSLNPSVPPALDALCARCLAKEPEGRFESAAALRIALEEARAGTARVPPRRSRALLAVGAGLLLLGGGVAAAWAGSRHEEEPEAEQVSVEVEAALRRADGALASGDARAALDALAAIGAAERAQNTTRVAALEGEARWLLGELEAARSAATSAGGQAPLLALLLAASDGNALAAPRCASELAAHGARPAGALARALALARLGMVEEPKEALRVPRAPADPRPLALSLLDGSGPDASVLDAVVPLLPALGRADLDGERGARLLARAAAQLVEAPEQALALVRPLARAFGADLAGLAGAAELRDAAVRRADAIAGERLPMALRPDERWAAYGRALPPLRVAVLLDPAAQPGEALTALLELLRPPSSEEQRAAREACKATADRAPPDLRSLREKWWHSPAASREIAWIASEALIMSGPDAVPEAREWLQAAIDAGPLELPDQDFVVQLAYVMSRDPARADEGWALLERVLAIDPLHSDALEIRGRRELERPEGDLAQAERDLRLACYADQRHRTLSSRMRDPFYWRVEAVRRTDPSRARALCDEWEDWPGETEAKHGARKKQRDALRERIDAALGQRSVTAAAEEDGGASSGQQLVEPDGTEPTDR